MTSQSLSADQSSDLFLLQEKEDTVIKELAHTQYDIHDLQTRLDALKKYYYEHDTIREKVFLFAEENRVSFEQIMTQYALNRIVMMKKEIGTLRSKPVSA